MAVCGSLILNDLEVILMIRKPNVGDTVYCVSKTHTRSRIEPFNAVVARVARKYFYVEDDVGRSYTFEIDGFENGAWCDKEYDMGHLHILWAYLSKDVYDEFKLKKQMIDEIVNRNKLEAMSLLKVNAIHFVLTNTKDFRKDWEVSDDL
jgi:hypothetical protein